MIPVPFEGGARVARGLALLGAVALLITALLGISDARRALGAYLFAWTYWGGVALGALILLGACHASNARWVVVLRRVLETVAASLPLFAVLFLPVAIGMKTLFPWVEPRGHDETFLHLVLHKRPYLNVPFFLVRAAVFLGIFVLVSELLLRWSRRQDRTGEITLTPRIRRLAAATLPVVGVAFSFAALDWIMSLEPEFYSTAYGLYWFAGSFVSAIAVLAAATALSRDPTHFGGLSNRSHRASLGKLLLAFTIFWFYILFSRYLIVWIADLPDEAGWWLVRVQGSWGVLAIVLVVAQFLVPFLLLLSRPLKENRAGLAFVAFWILAAHVIDVYWLVLPALDGGGIHFRAVDLFAFLGVGALSAGFVLERLRGHSTVPAKDPYLEESLHYAGRWS